MKKLVLSAVGILFTLGVFAQSQELGYGIKAGLNLPNYHYSANGTNTETDASTNFYVTAFLDAPIFTDYLYIQPGVSLQGKGAKFAEYEFNSNTYKLTQNTMWIEVPVNVVAKFPTGAAGHLFIGAGPYLGFGISGKNKLSDNNSSTDVGDFKFGKDEDQKGTDFGVNFTAGYQLSNGLIINGGYGLGITDIAPDALGVKQTNRVWSVGLGFAL